jgi:RNA polymerase sigma-70 factor (ECF subfamily)
MTALIEFIPTRRTLLSRLKDLNDEASWKDFFDTYWKLIYTTALKAGLSESEAEDVVQETIIGVCKQMPDFKYDPALGSFKAYLLRLTRWRINDQFRKRMPREVLSVHSPKPQAGGAGGRVVQDLENLPDDSSLELDRIWHEEWEKNLVERAIECVKRRVDPRQYQMFDLYYFQHWPVRKIAAQLRVKAGWVYLTKHRLSAMIHKEVKRLRKD